MNGLAWIRESGQEAQAWELIPSAAGNFGVAPFRGPVQRFDAVDRGKGVKGRSWMASALGGLVLPNVKPADSHAASDYVQLVGQARQACADGVLEKVVLSRYKAYHPSRVQPWEAFERLSDAYPQATVFLIHTPGGALWMGATPECLTELVGSSVRTMSLAGTRLRGSQGAWGLKEREEQHVVTKDIVQMIQALGVEAVQVEGPTVLEAGPVEHLCSHIEGRSAGLSAWDIAGALHPTPAVGGLPRAQAQAFIRRHEGYDRRYYAGYFGWTTNDRSIFYVTLRCVEWGADGFLGYAGGGITAKSDPVGEWAETEQKLQTLENVLLG